MFFKIPKLGLYCFSQKCLGLRNTLRCYGTAYALSARRRVDSPTLGFPLTSNT